MKAEKVRKLYKITTDFFINNQFKMYAAGNRIQDVKELIDEGFNVNYCIHNFATKAKLHTAGQIGLIKSVSFSLEREADPNISDP